jgi:hypothetical protein
MTGLRAKLTTRLSSPLTTDRQMQTNTNGHKETRGTKRHKQIQTQTHTKTDRRTDRKGVSIAKLYEGKQRNRKLIGVHLLVILVSDTTGMLLRAVCSVHE